MNELSKLGDISGVANRLEPQHLAHAPLATGFAGCHAPSCRRSSNMPPLFCSPFPDNERASQAAAQPAGCSACSQRTDKAALALHRLAALRFVDERDAARHVNSLLQRGASTSAACCGAGGVLPLHAAARANKAELVRALLPHSRRHLDSCCAGGSALHLAAERGAGEALAALLLEGADANVRRPGDGYTPLHVAAAAGDAAAVQLLLNHGANAGKATPAGETPLHLAAAAAAVGPPQQTDVLLALARQQPALLRQQPDCGLGTPLHILARRGRVAALRALLDHQPPLVSTAALQAHDRSGCTPLSAACAAGQLAAAELLLRRQLPLDQSQLLDALLAASHGGHAGIVQLLLLGGSGASGSSSSNSSRTTNSPGCSPASAVPWQQLPPGQHPLLVAVQQGHRTVVQALLAAGVPMPADALAEAVQASIRPVLGLLLAALPNSDADLQLSGGRTQRIYQHALQQGREPLLAQLLTWGLDPNGASCDGFTLGSDTSLAKAPLVQALAVVNHQAVRLLLQHGADPNLSTWHRQLLQQWHQTGGGADPPPLPLPPLPLHTAALMLDLEGVELLLAAGADPGLKDHRGCSALDSVLLEVCCSWDQVEAVGRLWPGGSRSFPERYLAQLVETLAAAGCSCDAFLSAAAQGHPSAANTIKAGLLGNGTAAAAEAASGAAGDKGVGVSSPQQPAAALQLVYPSLLLAAGHPRWSPQEHHRFPAAFRAAARAFLLVAGAPRPPSAVAVVAAAGPEGQLGGGSAAVAGGGRAGAGARAHASRRRGGRLAGMLSARPAGAPSERRAAAMQQGQQRVHLPWEVCWLVLEAASQRVSDWL